MVTRDRLEKALLSEDTYTSTRYEVMRHFKHPLSQKLKMQAGLFFLVALLAPMYIFFPSKTMAYIPVPDPVAATPRVIGLLAFGIAFEFFSVCGHLTVAYFVHTGDDIGRDKAVRLAALEEFSSLLGLGTGLLAIVIVVAVFSVGLFGLLPEYQAMMDVNPFETLGAGPSLMNVSTFGFMLATIVFVASSACETELVRGVE